MHRNRFSILRQWLQAMVFTIILLLPYGLKLVHAYQEHADVVKCHLTSTHLHQKKVHNDLLDYCFQPALEHFTNVETKSMVLDTFQLLALVSTLWLSPIDKTKSSRAPPVWV